MGNELMEVMAPMVRRPSWEGASNRLPPYRQRCAAHPIAQENVSISDPSADTTLETSQPQPTTRPKQLRKSSRCESPKLHKTSKAGKKDSRRCKECAICFDAVHLCGPNSRTLPCSHTF